MSAAEQAPSVSDVDVSDRKQALEQQICDQAKRFDLVALFQLLTWLGYARDEIELKSHYTSLQQSSVVESVQFAAPPGRQVRVTVNLGWLGPQSALPVYFRRVLDQDRGDLAEAFFSFFGQVLLAAGQQSSFPERNPAYFASFERTMSQLRSLLGARSLSTVHWVFALSFPEAETCVQRTILSRPLRNRGMVLGSWAIGDGMSCGGQSQVPVAAIAVTLYCNEPCDQQGRPWAIEAERRLQRECFPALRSPGLFLRVHLVIRDQSSFMVLQPRQYLGYEALPGATGQADVSPSLMRSRAGKISRTIVLFSGEVPQRAPS